MKRPTFKSEQRGLTKHQAPLAENQTKRNAAIEWRFLRPPLTIDLRFGYDIFDLDRT